MKTKMQWVVIVLALLAGLHQAGATSQGRRRKAIARWRISFTWTVRGTLSTTRASKNHTPIAVVGLRDSILVQTDDAVLLAHKSQAQKVKELVRKLSEDAKLKKLV